jgi:hypothetical protein
VARLSPYAGTHTAARSDALPACCRRGCYSRVAVGSYPNLPVCSPQPDLANKPESPPSWPYHFPGPCWPAGGLATLEGMHSPYLIPGPLQAQCWACGEVFPCERRSAKYCSAACRMWALRKQRAGEPWHFQHRRVTAPERHIPEQCGESVYCPGSRMEVNGSEHSTQQAEPLPSPTATADDRQQSTSSTVPLLCYRNGDGQPPPPADV